MYDRAVPEDCPRDKEFGFMLPCHEKLSGPLKSGLQTLGTTGMILAVLEVLALVLTVIVYSDLGNGYGSRDAARQAEVRHLLREGAIPAQQYTSSPSRAV